MKSCFIQCNSPLVKNVNVAQETKSFCQEQLVFCKLQINLKILDAQFVSVTIHDVFEIVCISVEA